EGMTDWALVQDTPVLLHAAEPSVRLDEPMASQAQQPMAGQLSEAMSPEPDDQPFAQDMAESLPVEEIEEPAGFHEESPANLSKWGVPCLRAGTWSGVPRANEATRVPDFSRDEPSRPGFGGTNAGEVSRNTQGSQLRRGSVTPGTASKSLPAA